MRISDEDMRGRTIIAADGQVVGEVSALFFDTEVWRVQALMVTLRKETADQVGVSRGLFHAATLEIPVRVIQSVGETVVLSVSIEALGQMDPHHSARPSAPR
jgi:sporulation protein YlmC with PRC-barrel domain